MSLDSTAKLINVRRSIKKHLVDFLEVTNSKELLFDKGLPDPDLFDKSINEWIVVNFGESRVTGLSQWSIDIFSCTRMDSEGERLILLYDLVMDCFTDNLQSDGCRYIPLYETAPTPWTDTGVYLMVNPKNIIGSPEMDGPDETKYKMITCPWQWVAKA